MKKFFSFLLLIGLAHSQSSPVHTIQGPGEGWLSASINPVTGNFSAYNLRETDPNYVPLLFGGPGMSSHISYLVDGAPVHQSNLSISTPMGATAGYQIDGVFSLKDIRVELAYFLMDTGTNGELKTLGIAVLASNISELKTHRLGVKILLDTESGELAANRPSFFLPSGRALNEPRVFDGQNIPEYIFLGEQSSTAGMGEGKGFYVYPYLSAEFPSALVLENWRRLASAPWIPQKLGQGFSFDSDIQDGGMGIYFGEYTLSPNEEIAFGVALSLDKIVTVPVLKDGTRSLLEEESLTQGVFAPNRYLINEMLINKEARNGPALVPGRGLAPSPQNADADSLLQKDLSLGSIEPLSRRLLKMQGTMDELRRTYDQKMGRTPPNQSYVHPPYQGISERYYPQ